MKKNVLLLAVASVVLFAGCAGTIRQDPAALHGDYSGKDFSGTVAIIRAPGDIPGVPQSKGQRARWSEVEVEQVLYFDADCQAQLFQQLPGWAQAIAKEGGWSALAVAVGEAGFAAAFPGSDVVRFFLGGLGFGAATGANTGRYRQDSSEKSAQGYCVIQQLYDAQYRWKILGGIMAVPWYGNGGTMLPKSTNPATDLATPPAYGAPRPLP